MTGDRYAVTRSDDTTVITDKTSTCLNPKNWTKKTKFIAASAALAFVLAGTGGFAYHQYTIERDCKAQSKVFTDQKDNLSKAVQEAHDALDSVDASVKVGEGKRLEHTDDFPLSP